MVRRRQVLKASGLIIGIGTVSSGIATAGRTGRQVWNGVKSEPPAAAVQASTVMPFSWFEGNEDVSTGDWIEHTFHMTVVNSPYENSAEGAANLFAETEFGITVEGDRLSNPKRYFVGPVYVDGAEKWGHTFRAYVPPQKPGEYTFEAEFTTPTRSGSSEGTYHVTAEG